MKININEQFANANSAASDKITRHGYQRFYPFFLQHLRSIEGISLLEIGFHVGNSITLWNNYFINPRIHAIDIKEDVVHPSLTAYYKVDQSKPDELKAFVQNVKTKFHFILDDGSHAPEHQWNTFIEFFPLLLEGGTYIIEDVETSFWGKSNVYGYPIDSNRFSLFEKLKALPYIINNEFIAKDIRKQYGLTKQEFNVLMEVEIYTVGHNCIMFLKKNHKAFRDYYRNFDKYALKGNIDSKRDDIFYRIKTNPRLKKIFGRNG
jgi:hypothetical protein